MHQNTHLETQNEKKSAEALLKYSSLDPCPNGDGTLPPYTLPHPFSLLSPMPTGIFICPWGPDRSLNMQILTWKVLYIGLSHICTFLMLLKIILYLMFY